MLEQVDVRAVWSAAEPMLEALLEKTPQDSKPVDVYTACVNSYATMFMPDDDDEGLIVVSIRENQFTGESYLFVWMAYHKDKNAQEIYGQEIEDLARRHGCAYIEFESRRRGFERRGDWEMLNTTFRKKL